MVIQHRQLRFTVAAVMLLLGPSVAQARRCPAGEQKAHGKCVPVRGQPTPAGAREPVAVRAALPAVSAALPPALPPPSATTRSLRAGSSIRDATFTGVGAIARPRGVNPGVTIEDVRTTGATHLIRTYTYADALPDVTVRRVTMTDNGAGGLLFRGASSGTIRDVTIAAARPETNCSKVPEGIALAGKGAGDTGGPWTISRIRVTGIRSAGCRFLNGDGLAIERGYHDITVTDAYLGGNSDAGADIKSPSARLDRVVSEGNRRNFKFWADQTHGTLTSIDPGQAGSGTPAHIQLQGDRTVTRTMHIAQLIARSATPVPIFVVENGPWDITVDRCQLAVPRGTPMLVGEATLHLGPGCTVPR